MMRLPIRVLAMAALVSGALVVPAAHADTHPARLAPAKTAGLSEVGGRAAPPNMSAPSAHWTDDGDRVDVFTTSRGDLYQKYWTRQSGWHGWFRFAPPTAGIHGAPSISWTADGDRLDVFVTGNSDRRLYQKYWIRGDGWSRWLDLGGRLRTSPTASWTDNSDRIDVFGVHPNGHLYQKYWTRGGGWHGWFRFAAPTAGIGGAASATWTADGDRLDVFVTGNSDRHLYQKYWTRGDGWSRWVEIGGRLRTSPSASWTDNDARIDVFGIHPNGRLYQKYWTDATGWQGWYTFQQPGAGIFGPPSATWTADGERLDVFVTGSANRHLYQKYWTRRNGWSGWVHLG